MIFFDPGPSKTLLKGLSAPVQHQINLSLAISEVPNQPFREKSWQRDLHSHRSLFASFDSQQKLAGGKLNEMRAAGHYRYQSCMCAEQEY